MGSRTLLNPTMPVSESYTAQSSGYEKSGARLTT